MRSRYRVFSIVLIAIAAWLAWSAAATAQTEFKLTAADAVVDVYSVSIAGDYAIVGAYGDDDGGAYIFNWDGTSWTEQQKLTATDSEISDNFGVSVSIAGDYAIVGAYNDDDAGSNSGSAYIFKRDGASWTQQAKLTATDAAAQDYFGFSVSIAGDYAIVGARFDDDGGEYSGSAYIFKRDGTSWTEQQKITAADAAAGDSFGFSVSIAGDYAIVGSDNDDDAGSNSGSAYIFKRDGTSWTEQQKLTAADAAAGDSFGRSVSIAGDYAFVGSDNDDDAGSAYIFKRDGASWTQQAKLTATDAAAGDSFGRSVSIAGDYAVVGAYGDDDGGFRSGSAYIFKRDGASWTQQAKLTASDAAAHDYFGYSVSIAGDYAIVGSDNGNGSAYVYTLKPLVELSPTVLSLGDVVLGSSKIDSVKVKNPGLADLSVSAIAVSGADAALFTVTPATLSVPASDSAYVKVTYAPTAAGADTASLQLTHNADGSPTSIPLIGFGLGPVSLFVETDFVKMGETGTIQILLDNSISHEVGGLSFNIGLSSMLNKGLSVKLIPPPDQEVTTEPNITAASLSVDAIDNVQFSGTNVSVVIHQVDTGTTTLEYPNNPSLLTLEFTVPSGGPSPLLGTAYSISIQNDDLLFVSDTGAYSVPQGTAIEIPVAGLVSGQLQIGRIRDIDNNGSVNILDAVTLANYLLGKFSLISPTPPEGTTHGYPNQSSVEYKIFDGNEDGQEIAVADLVAIVNEILGLPITPPAKSIASGPAVIDLGTIITMDDGRLAIPVYLDAPGTMSGASLDFNFDPAVLKVESPVLATGSGNIGFDSHVTEDGTLRTIIYSLSTEGLATGSTPLLLIPITFLSEADDATVTLTNFVLANNQAQTYPVELGAVTQTFNKAAQIPTSFALQNNSPNPFNPSTRIAYDVPEQVHITLTVYNLLGQEVVRLMDQVQAAGRYEVVWHGVNTRGAGVASGVYLYRIVSGSGYKDTKRMTLLK